MKMKRDYLRHVRHCANADRKFIIRSEKKLWKSLEKIAAITPYAVETIRMLYDNVSPRVKIFGDSERRLDMVRQACEMAPAQGISPGMAMEELNRQVI